MNPFQSNPFSILSLIAAPAVLTNASSVLALGTSNRFARAIDRSRALLSELEKQEVVNDSHTRLRVRQMDRTERRCLFLLRAMRCFYLALGCFAATSLVSVVGAGVAGEVPRWFFPPFSGLPSPWARSGWAAWFMAAACSSGTPNSPSRVSMKKLPSCENGTGAIWKRLVSPALWMGKGTTIRIKGI